MESCAELSCVCVEFVFRNLSGAEARWLVQTSRFISSSRLLQKSSRRLGGMKLFALWRCAFIWIDFTGSLESARGDLANRLLDV